MEFCTDVAFVKLCRGPLCNVKMLAFSVTRSLQIVAIIAGNASFLSVLFTFVHFSVCPVYMY